MGTNYYHHTAVCSKCGEGEESHIGKSSFGWTFNWHALEDVKSCDEWYDRLGAGGSIIDEYGEIISLEDFRKLVDEKRNSKHNHALEYPEGNWTDDDGCSFSDNEFS